MRTIYSKYTFVCTGDCDALIEYTFKDGFGWPNGVMQLTCPCNSTCTLLSVEDATIPPINQTKEEKMETTFGATVTDMNFLTREFLETQLVENKARIAQLEEHVQRVTQRDFSTSAELNKMRDNMKEFTMEGLDDDSLSEGQAGEIASICGFELTNEYELEVTVMYSITVNARDEEQALNAMYDIDFDAVSYNDDFINYLSSSVDRVEVQ